MARKSGLDPERRRLQEDALREKNWKRWGPYLSDRQWGTVREDYSADGSSWTYFPHEQARSRAYRWGEDGLLGITDRECRLCFALALWNGRDPFLKERLFGLTNREGNHGEDAKECWFHLEALPTSSYLKALYKYPQGEFPYARLVEENRRRSRTEPEFELADTGIFDEDRYFDVFVEYAKAGPDDILIRITVANRGPDEAVLHLLPTLWFRNTWSWGCKYEGCWIKPRLWQAGDGSIVCQHATLERMVLRAGPDLTGKMPALLFTENETNAVRLFGAVNESAHVKDAFHDYVVSGRVEAVNPQNRGTKAAAHYVLTVPPRQEAVIRLRLLAEKAGPGEVSGPWFDDVFANRRAEVEQFYQGLPPTASEQDGRISRQAYAGLLWNKQFYEYVIADWLEGDPNQPTPPAQRKAGRNQDWKHLYNRDVISMPDKWEYPWYASWDLAFHMIPLAHVDPEFAKEQLVLFLREWYMHPDGALPAYEWNLDDVNPPVHAWACWRVYKIAGQRGKRDRFFLGRVFQKLLINFTWWVNRKDVAGKHLFAGGFLGLDNISLFDRSKPLPNGAALEQADGTAWMAFYCVTMLAIALELAQDNPAYSDVASKFFEHFVAIADAMNTLGGTGLWDDRDGFYYDQMHVDGESIQLRLRSLVGLLPLIAVEILEDDVVARLPAFRKRMEWFLQHRRDLAEHITYLEAHPGHGHRLLAIPSAERLRRVLGYLFDEKEFLSPFGIRSLSRVHQERPYVCDACGSSQRVDYEPGESTTDMFGGNSNWRGPVWLPLNYLLIEALERYHHFYGDSLLVEVPTGSGRTMNLRQAARELADRLVGLFRPDEAGRRPCHGGDRRFADDPHWRDMLWFHEYFHGDTGQGLGASHQTGWTALVTRLLHDCSKRQSEEGVPKAKKPRAAAPNRARKPRG
jgi:hypothetical protein